MNPLFIAVKKTSCHPALRCLNLLSMAKQKPGFMVKGGFGVGRTGLVQLHEIECGAK